MIRYYACGDTLEITQGRMQKMILAASGLLSSIAFAPADKHVGDAVDAFSSLCVSATIGKKAALDLKRFEITKLDDAAKEKIRPEGAYPYWNVRGTESGVSMLIHYEPRGPCVVELAEVDEKLLQAAVERVAIAAATEVGTTATAQPAGTLQIDQNTATTVSWRFKTPKGNVLLMLASMPMANADVQHVMTAWIVP